MGHHQLKSFCLFYFALLLALPAQAACPWNDLGDILLTERSSYFATERELSLEELRTDLDCVEKIFQLSYIGNDFYLKYGFSMEARLASVRERLSLQTKAQLIQSLLQEIHMSAYDLHVGYSLYSPSGAQTYVLPKYVPMYISEIDDIQTCTSMALEESLLPDGSIKRIFAGQFFETNVPERVSCLTKSGRVRELPARPMVYDKVPDSGQEFFYEIRDDGILYIRFRGFNFGVELNDRLRELAALMGDPSNERPVIVDLRGTSGGSPLFPLEFAASIMTTDQVIPNDPEAAIKLSLMSAAGMANYFFLRYKTDLEEGRTLEAEVNRKTYERYAAQAEELAEKMPFEITQIKKQRWPATPSGEPITGRRRQAYSRPIVVLIDKVCISACEAFAGWLKGLPQVHLIGSPTFGTAHFGTPAHLVLPNSKIVMRGATFAWNIGGRTVEGTGVLPDIYAPEGDALTKAVNFIRRRFK